MDVDIPKIEEEVHKQENEVQPCVEDPLHNGVESEKSDSPSITTNDVCTKEESPQNETSEEDHTDVEDEGEESEVKNGEFQFRTKSIHIVKTRQGKKQYKCDVCTGIYQHAFSLKRHFLRTHINYRFLSEADVTNCNINPNLVRKLKVEGDENRLGLYRCHICGQLFDRRDELKSHDSSHPDGNSLKGFSCNQCEMTFPHRQNLVRHQSVHLEETRSGEVVESAESRQLCQKAAHREKFHPCGFCSKFFTQREKLLRHIQIHHSAPFGEVDAKKPKTPRGNVVFKRKKKGKRFEPHSEYRYTCSVCRRKFSTYVNLCRHKKAMHATSQQEKRTRPPHLRKETPRSKAAAKQEMSEEEFYMTIAHRISENLLYHLDGKSSQLNTKRDPSAFPEDTGSKDNLHWSIYNFPAAFDITQMMQIYSSWTPSVQNTLSTDGSDNSDETECTFTSVGRKSAPQKPSSKPTEGLLPDGALPKIFICSVCTEKFYSHRAIEDHKVNNHPNVVCTHLEFEGQKDVPPELCWMLRGPVRMIQNTPTMNEMENLKCTKCESVFMARADLHQHILECGTDSSFERNRVKSDFYPWRLGHHGRRSGSIPSYFRGRKRHIFEPRHRTKTPPKKQKYEADLEDAKASNEPDDSIQMQVDIPEEKDIVIEDGAYEVVDNTEESTGDNSVNQGISIEGDNNGEIEEAVGNVASGHEDVCSESEVHESQVEAIPSRGSKDEVNVSNENSSDALLVHDYLQVSSPREVRSVDEHRSECTVAEDVEAAHTPSSASSTPDSFLKQDAVVKEETVVEEFTGGGNATVPVLEGRVLRSKTAAASAASASFAKSHTCSTCKRKFAYLASLKKHLQDICPNKKVTGEKMPRRRGKGKVPKDRDRLEISAENLGQSSDPFEAADTRSPEVKDVEPSVGSCDTACDRLGDIDLFPDEKSEESPSNADDRNNNVLEQSRESSLETKASLSAAKIKQEDDCVDTEDGDRVKSKASRQEHCCPYCLHSFAYLSNFRKHIREVCLLKKKAMQASSEGTKPTKLRSSSPKYPPPDPPCRARRHEAASSTTLNFKGNIENSVINLLRNQSKQMEIIGTPTTGKEQGGGPTSASFMTFSCPVCHKIFLSYVKMLQHRLSHKLQTEDGAKEERNEQTLLNGGEEVGDRKTDVAAGKPHQGTAEVVRVKSEEERFDEILMTLRNQRDTITNEAKAEKDCGTNDDVVCLSELADLPDEDDKVVEEKCKELKKETEDVEAVMTKEGNSEVEKREEEPAETENEINANNETRVEAVTPSKKNASRSTTGAGKKCVKNDKATPRKRHKKPPFRSKSPKDKL